MEEKTSTDIVALNRDVEPALLATTGLTFVHTADMHGMPTLWARMVRYIDHYADKIAFALHTGDYCGGYQGIYTDMYAASPCRRPIYNCVGNHDCFPGGPVWHLGEKAVAHGLLFNHAADWGATFFDCPHSMSYYKDMGDVRLIVLDDYYDIWPTRAWLRGILREARERGLHVITAQHEPSGYVENAYGVRYHTYEDINTRFREIELSRTAYDFDHRGRVLYEDIIAEHIALGGQFVCNLAGHDHHDEFGPTERGVLNLVVQNGTTWDAISDTVRVVGERSEDCFNVVSVDTARSLLTVIRIGANTDKMGRVKRAFCFDYQNKKLISEV